MGEKCENCVYYSYDEEYDAYICEMDLDEDEMVRFLSSRVRPSQNLCKPPMWCRIEAPHWRFL